MSAISFSLSPHIKLLGKSKNFWYQKDITKTNNKGETVIVDTKIVFSYIDFFEFLQSQKIGRYELNEEIIFVWLDKHIIRTVNPQKIRDFSLNYVFTQAEDPETIQKMLQNAGMYFGENNLNSSPYIHLPATPKMPNQINLYFENGFTNISKEKIEVFEATETKNFVWENDIIKHAISLEDLGLTVHEENGQPILDMTKTSREKAGDFFEYLYQTSNFYHTKNELSDIEARNINRALLNKMSAIGYFLQPYKDPITTKAIICMDYKVSEVGESNGGTGKSIFGKAIEKILNTKYINAKNPKVWEDSFVYQGTDQRTKLLFIDDAEQNINFGMFYNIVTGTFNINRKNLPAIDLKFEDSPKLLITTNHALKGSGESDLRRQFLLAFSDFFTIENTPIKHLGRRLFDDWDFIEWNKFYNLVIFCSKIYLKYGLIEGENENLELRKLRQEIGEQFITWSEIYFTPEMNLDIELERQLVYKEFEYAFPQFVKKYCDTRAFKKKCQKYAKMKSWEFEERKSGGKEYFKFATKKQEKAF